MVMRGYAFMGVCVSDREQMYLDRTVFALEAERKVGAWRHNLLVCFLLQCFWINERFQESAKTLA